MKKVALITGITGQDGSYLAELLLKKNYKVHGIIRKSSSFNTSRIDHLYIDPHNRTNFFLHYGDLTDSNSIYNLIHQIKPQEIYNSQNPAEINLLGFEVRLENDIWSRTSKNAKYDFA